MAEALQRFITEAFTLLGVAVSVIGLRTYSRWSTVGFRELQPDDFLMIVAGVVYGLETGAAYSVGAIFKGLANNGMTDEQRVQIVPGSEEWDMRIGGSKVQLVGWSLYTLLLWLLKTCMAIFYTRLTIGMTDMRLRTRIAFVSIGVTYATTILSILFGCHPFHKNWQINPDPGNYCQPAISKINLYVTVVLNVVTDLYLMSIPLPLLWKANLNPKRKALLLFMFSGGAFIIMAGILRCALIIADPINGAMQAGSWACRETFVAVIIGNIPMIYPFFMRAFKKMQTSVFSSGLGSSLGKRSNGGADGDVELGDRAYERERPSKPLRRKPNPMSLAGLTTLGPSESEEEIMKNQNMKPGSAGNDMKLKNGISVVTEVTTVTRGESRSSQETHKAYNDDAYGERQFDRDNRQYEANGGYTVRVAGGGYDHQRQLSQHAR